MLQIARDLDENAGVVLATQGANHLHTAGRFGEQR